MQRIPASISMFVAVLALAATSAVHGQDGPYFMEQNGNIITVQQGQMHMQPKGQPQAQPQGNNQNQDGTLWK
jgi:hypothetical protein